MKKHIVQPPERISRPDDWEKAYVIGPAVDKYTSGPWISLDRAKEERGEAGEYIFRLKKGESLGIRVWDDKLEAWRGGRPAPVTEADKEDEQAPPVSNDVELAFFESHLRIDKDALDEALLEQADMMGKVSSRYALALSLRDEAKDRVKQVEGALYAEIKEDIEKTDNKRPTDKGIEARINSHLRRVKAVDRHVKTIRESMEWEGMFEAYKARGFALGELNKLYIAGYFTVSSARANANDARQRQGETARADREKAYAKRRSERQSRDE